MKKFFVLLAALTVGFVAPAQAHQHHKHSHAVASYAVDPGCNVIFPCQGVSPSPRGVQIAAKLRFGAPVLRYAPAKQPRHVSASHNTGGRGAMVTRTGGGAAPVSSYGVPSPPLSSAIDRVERSVEVIVAHPAGCPSRAFCGCGAAVRVFGAPIRALWLAANWFKFPRSAPAPGMVAVKRHHVFVLEADLGGGVWKVYDANSGRHMTRIHARSIAGWPIVNPHGGNYASAS